MVSSKEGVGGDVAATKLDPSLSSVDNNENSNARNDKPKLWGISVMPGSFVLLIRSLGTVFCLCPE